MKYKLTFFLSLVPLFAFSLLFANPFRISRRRERSISARLPSLLCLPTTSAIIFTSRATILNFFHPQRRPLWRGRSYNSGILYSKPPRKVISCVFEFVRSRSRSIALISPDQHLKQCSSWQGAINFLFYRLVATLNGPDRTMSMINAPSRHPVQERPTKRKVPISSSIVACWHGCSVQQWQRHARSLEEDHRDYIGEGLSHRWANSEKPSVRGTFRKEIAENSRLKKEIESLNSALSSSSNKASPHRHSLNPSHSRAPNFHCYCNDRKEMLRSVVSSA